MSNQINTNRINENEPQQEIRNVQNIENPRGLDHSIPKDRESFEKPQGAQNSEEQKDKQPSAHNLDNQHAQMEQIRLLIEMLNILVHQRANPEARNPPHPLQRDNPARSSHQDGD